MTRQRASFITVLMAFASVTVASCESGEDKTGSEKPVAAVSAGRPMPIRSAEELAAESRRAIDGDAAAADRVANHYALGDFPVAEAEFWIDVAVYNGSVQWLALHAAKLAEQGGEYKCGRAQYLMRRAIKIAPDQEKELSARMESFREYPECQTAAAP